MIIILLQLTALLPMNLAWSWSGGWEEEPLSFNYHEKVGIPQATRLEELEKENEYNIQPRIVGGNTARRGQFKHFCGVRVDLPGGIRSVCGATLISKTRVLTAAHCWYDGKTQALRFTVVLGSTNLLEGGTRINTSTVWTHEDWDPKPNNMANDIAIIVITSITYSKYIRNIALPTGSLADNTFEGSEATAVGFGRIYDSAPLYLNQLQYAVVEVSSDDLCQEWFKNYSGDKSLCVGTSSGKSPCFGDSGGPLQTNAGEDGKPVLIGVMSHGIKVCEIGSPVVYTRVTAYLDWIMEKLEAEE